MRGFCVRVLGLGLTFLIEMVRSPNPREVLMRGGVLQQIK